MHKVGIVGLGRAGKAMAYLLKQRGYEVLVVPHKITDEKVYLHGEKFYVKDLQAVARLTDLLFITTPDNVISEIAQDLQDCKNITIKAVLHMSGSMTSHVLKPLKSRNIKVGALHPLQSLASIEQAIENLPGTYFSFEGDNELVEWVTLLVNKMGGNLKIIPRAEVKTYYHCGACIASNYLVVLVYLAVQCLQEAGFTEEEGRQALIPLIKGTINNLSNLPLPSALTGPVVRGDSQTIQSHLKALEENLPQLLPAYLELGRGATRIATEHGKLTPLQVEDLKNLLSGG